MGHAKVQKRVESSRRPKKGSKRMNELGGTLPERASASNSILRRRVRLGGEARRLGVKGHYPYKTLTLPVKRMGGGVYAEFFGACWESHPAENMAQPMNKMTARAA